MRSLTTAPAADVTCSNSEYRINKLFPFPYAADDRTEPPIRQRDHEPNRRLLVLGQINQRKGVLQALKDVADYARQHTEQQWDLTFIGSGPLKDALVDYPVPTNLKVSVLGSIDPIELAPKLNEYGILLFPTLADEWGLVVNEGMRAGMPVMGSRYAQASTTLIDERTQRLVGLARINRTSCMHVYHRSIRLVPTKCAACARQPVSPSRTSPARQ